MAMSKNLTEGSKVASAFIKSLGLTPDYHVGASIANIVSGHFNYAESCLRDMRTYLRHEGVKMDDEQLDKLISLTRAAL